MYSLLWLRSLIVTTSVVGKLEQMLGSFSPHPEGKPHEGKFEEESPSGLVARSGTYHARSRVVDDDGEVFAGLFSDTVMINITHLTHGVLRLGMVVQTCQGMVNERGFFCSFHGCCMRYTLCHHLHISLT